MNHLLQFPYQTSLTIEITLMGSTNRAEYNISFNESNLILTDAKHQSKPIVIEFTSIASISQIGNKISLTLNKPIGPIKKMSLIFNDDTTQNYIDYVVSIVEEQNASNPIQTISKYHIPIVKHIVLLLFTFGIWQLIWIYKTTDALNNLSKEPYRSPETQLLLCIFVPFYLIYWIYKSAQGIDFASKARGEDSDFATIAIILAIFIPLVAIILMQDKINHIG